MPVLVSTHFGRPHYVKQSVKSLEKCEGIGRYTYIACLDRKDPEIVSIIDRSSLKTHICINEKTLGVDLNTERALKMGFEMDDFVILVEGDVVLGQDALNYYEWCRRQYQDDKTIFTVTAYSSLFHDGLDNEIQETANGTKLVKRRPYFSGVTFGIWRDRWNEVKDRWIDGTHPISKQPMVNLGWDIRMRGFRGDRQEIFPLYSRANHIGLTDGLNSGYDNLNKVLLDEKWYFDNTYVKCWAEHGTDVDFIE